MKPKMKNLSMSDKVAVPSKGPSKMKSQPIVGKLGGSMESMPGSKGKGQAIKTVPSNPIQGKTKSTGTAMGGKGIIDGFVK